MTNEQALKVLKYRSGWNLSIRDVNALDMAIKALEQEPCYNPDEWCKTCKEYNHDKHCCPRYNKVIRNAVEEMKQEPCGYAISRQAVLDVIEREQFKGDAISEIEKLPPVQPKPKVGHWIHRSTDAYGGITTWYECSECGRAVEDIYHVYDKYPYCHCGCRMVEPQESEGKE